MNIVNAVSIAFFILPKSTVSFRSPSSVLELFMTESFPNAAEALQCVVIELSGLTDHN